MRLNDRGEIIDRPQGSAAVFTEELGNGIPLTMVKIPPGQFMMGQSKAESSEFTLTDKTGQKIHNGFEDELPQHQVQVPEFYLGQTLVTQAQWQAIMGSNPSHFKGDGKLPVDNVNWLQAMDFCDKLSQRTGKVYRLPTEAEWEYACRSGTRTTFAFGETISPAVVNYNGDNSYGNAAKSEYRKKTTIVSSFSPNGFGLYDMHGNLWEWCLDEYISDYNQSPVDGSASGDTKSRDGRKKRLLRGGSWVSHASDCRSARRFGLPAAALNIGGINVGLRIVLEPSSTS